MKTYKISIRFFNYLDDDTLEDFEYEDRKEYEYFLSLDGENIEVSTLEEYFNLINRVYNLTEGEYGIYNNGTLITLYN